MRNTLTRYPLTRYACCAGSVLLLALAVGCESNEQKIADHISQGEVALGGQRYDVAESEADEALRLGTSAQAHYLRGRAEESRPKPNAMLEASDLSEARGDYQAALNLNPGEPLASRCRSGLANVAFAQNDYSTALFQWTSALDNLDEPEWRAFALYRIGQCQQRLGRFNDADATFQQVIQQYPMQEVAMRAQAEESVRGFYVQVGAYSNPDDASGIAKSARAAGLPCKLVAVQGLIAVRSGLYSTYSDALQARESVSGQFPDAVIGP